MSRFVLSRSFNVRNSLGLITFFLYAFLPVDFYGQVSISVEPGYYVSKLLLKESADTTNFNEKSLSNFQFSLVAKEKVDAASNQFRIELGLRFSSFTYKSKVKYEITDKEYLTINSKNSYKYFYAGISYEIVYKVKSKICILLPFCNYNFFLKEREVMGTDKIFWHHSLKGRGKITSGKSDYFEFGIINYFPTINIKKVRLALGLLCSASANIIYPRAYTKNYSLINVGVRCNLSYKSNK